MGHIINILFSPPPLPPIDLSVAARLIPGIQETIAKAFELAYYRGVYDGVVAGVLLALLFVPSIRSRVARGASHAANHL